MIIKYLVSLLFVSCVEYSHRVFEKIYGEQIIVVDVDGIGGSTDVVLGGQPQTDRVVCMLQQLQCLRRRINDTEVLLQCLPSEGVEGLEEGGIDSEGVIDAEVVQVGGPDVGVVLVASVEVGDIERGEEARPERGQQHGESEEEHQHRPNHPLSFYALRFHAFISIWWKMEATLSVGRPPVA